MNLNYHRNIYVFIRIKSMYSLHRRYSFLWHTNQILCNYSENQPSYWSFGITFHLIISPCSWRVSYSMLHNNPAMRLVGLIFLFFYLLEWTNKWREHRLWSYLVFYAVGHIPTNSNDTLILYCHPNNVLLKNNYNISTLTLLQAIIIN